MSKEVSLCKNCNQTFDLCPCNHNLTSVLGCTLNSNCSECCYAEECEAKMSKGSWYRPVNKKKYDESYDRIFGEKKKGDNRRRDNNKGQIQTEDDVQGSDEAGIS